MFWGFLFCFFFCGWCCRASWFGFPLTGAAHFHTDHKASPTVAVVLVCGPFDSLSHVDKNLLFHRCLW